MRSGLGKRVRNWLSPPSSPASYHDASPAPSRRSSRTTESDPPSPRRSFSVPTIGSFQGSPDQKNPIHSRFRRSRTRGLNYLVEEGNMTYAPLGTQCGVSLAQVVEELAPIPGINTLVGGLTLVYQAIERSRVNREQWKLLQGRCAMVARIAGGQVVNHGQHSYPDLENAASMLAHTFDMISSRARHYNEMNEIVAFLQFQTISDEIKTCFSELDLCLTLFSCALDVAQSQWVAEFQAVQHRELMELARVHNLLSSMNTNLESVAHSQDQLLALVGVLRQELAAKSAILENPATTTLQGYDDAQQIVRTILSVTNLQLPPKLLVGRQCILEANVPIKTGLTCDIYIASFLGGEKVAKKVFRIGMSDHDFVKRYAERFLRIASLWSELRSNYTLPFYGIGMESPGGDRHFQLYMVSPLLKNYDAVTYLNRFRNNEGMKQGMLRIITDAALGLQYLHNQEPPVVHSGMRGDNILVTDSGGAVLGGFGLTKALESEANDKIPTAVMTGRTESQRWMAPELFADDTPQIQTACDVWGWAMAALEIVSGLVPYHLYAQIFTVIGKVRNGPPRREDHVMFEDYAYQPDEMWELFEKCWENDPSKRPTMDFVVMRLKEIAKMPGLVS